MAIQLTSVNGQLFGNNQPIGGGTIGRQYLPTSDTNILINEDIAMTICNNNTNSTFNKLGNGINGSTSTVNALAVDSTGNVYVGGSFASVTNPNGDVIVANNIAKWNPSSNTWSALGGGTNGVVNALAFDSSGNLYVGGDFATVTNPNGSTPSTVRVNRIAKWNPSPSSNTWSALGGGASGNVLALAFDSNGNLYVGGVFTTVTNPNSSVPITVNNIAKWNPSPSLNTWSALGSGTNNSVNALAFDSTSANNMYVGGNFTTINDVTVNRIAKILTDTIINISINNNYLTTLISNQYQCFNYFKVNNRSYKTSNGQL